MVFLGQFVTGFLVSLLDLYLLLGGSLCQHDLTQRCQLQLLLLVALGVGDAGDIAEELFLQRLLHLLGFLSVLLLVLEGCLVVFLLRLQPFLGAFVVDVDEVLEVGEFHLLQFELVGFGGNLTVRITLISGSLLVCIPLLLILHRLAVVLLLQLFLCLHLGSLRLQVLGAVLVEQLHPGTVIGDIRLNVGFGVLLEVLLTGEVRNLILCLHLSTHLVQLLETLLEFVLTSTGLNGSRAGRLRAITTGGSSQQVAILNLTLNLINRLFYLGQFLLGSFKVLGLDADIDGIGVLEATGRTCSTHRGTHLHLSGMSVCLLISLIEIRLTVGHILLGLHLLLIQLHQLLLIDLHLDLLLELLGVVIDSVGVIVNQLALVGERSVVLRHKSLQLLQCLLTSLHGKRLVMHGIIEHVNL